MKPVKAVVVFPHLGDPSEALEFVEEALDLTRFLIEPPIDWRGDGAAGIGFYVGGCAEIIGNEIQ